MPRTALVFSVPPPHVPEPLSDALPGPAAGRPIRLRRRAVPARPAPGWPRRPGDSRREGRQRSRRPARGRTAPRSPPLPLPSSTAQCHTAVPGPALFGPAAAPGLRAGDLSHPDRRVPLPTGPRAAGRAAAGTGVPRRARPAPPSEPDGLRAVRNCPRQPALRPEPPAAGCSQPAAAPRPGRGEGSRPPPLEAPPTVFGISPRIHLSLSLSLSPPRIHLPPPRIHCATPPFPGRPSS